MIWLLRHGEAAEGSPDADRPLTDKGEDQSRAAGAALEVLDVRLDACLASPKLRAAQTARLACEQLSYDVEVGTEPRLSGGPFEPEELVAGLGEDVLLVGHDPDFSMAIHRLTGAQVRMKKGGLACVHKGELLMLMRPKELSALAGARRLEQLEQHSLP